MTIENCVEEPPFQEAVEADPERDNILKSLAQNTQICFKSQQKWEADLTEEEKIQIALDIFTNNKVQFLIKFGKYLKYSQLDYFKKLNETIPDEEIGILIKDLSKTLSETHNTVVKNRRYQAMTRMIQENAYFSEIEMMKRNPLLYNQLVGQYLTPDEVEERDRYQESQMGLVKILMEGIERDTAEEIRKKHEEIENMQIEQEKDDKDIPKPSLPGPSTSHWGEIGDAKIQQKAFSSKGRKKVTKITPDEQKLLKEEFITTMYHSFLDGKDEDFDYDYVDNDTSYDNTEEMEKDEEEKYFDSEQEKIGECYIAADSSDDELDLFMKSLK